MSDGTLIGIIVGSVVGLAIIAFIICRCMKKSKHDRAVAATDATATTNPPGMIYSTGPTDAAGPAYATGPAYTGGQANAASMNYATNGKDASNGDGGKPFVADTHYVTGMPVTNPTYLGGQSVAMGQPFLAGNN